MTNKQAEELFWNRVEKSDPASCWPWRAGRTGSGYGAFYLEGKTLRAHRLAWLFGRGPITGNLCVLHKCDNPPCCNPAHLFLGTHGDNAKDRQAKGRTRTRPHNAHKTHCPKGHPYIGYNVYFNARTRNRQCRACHNARQRPKNRAYRAAKKATLQRIAKGLGIGDEL